MELLFADVVIADMEEQLARVEEGLGQLRSECERMQAKRK